MMFEKIILAAVWTSVPPDWKGKTNEKLVLTQSRRLKSLDKVASGMEVGAGGLGHKITEVESKGPNGRISCGSQHGGGFCLGPAGWVFSRVLF